MSIEILMQYATMILVAIGVLAFLTSIITQVIKEMPGLANIQTNAVAVSYTHLGRFFVWTRKGINGQRK